MLYLVATPIGNLNDITLRALTVLREVDVVASEDTRKTGMLLKHFDIHKPQISFHEYNEQRAGEQIEELLRQGKSVAVVTNAGTPGISDPGFTLVRRANQCSVGRNNDPGANGVCDGPGFVGPARTQLYLSRFPADGNLLPQAQIHGDR